MPRRSNFEDAAGHRVELMAIDWELVERVLDEEAGADAHADARRDLTRDVLTVGTIDGRLIPCLTASAQFLFHTGFPLEAAGQGDLDLLRSETGSTP